MLPTEAPKAGPSHSSVPREPGTVPAFLGWMGLAGALGSKRTPADSQ